MNITVNLHTILQKRTEDGVLRSFVLTVPDGTIVVDLLARLEIALDPDDLLITVNGQVAEENHGLSDGDHVDLIPAISGGIT